MLKCDRNAFLKFKDINFFNKNLAIKRRADYDTMPPPSHKKPVKK
jgi:hypothetical protein